MKLRKKYGWAWILWVLAFGVIEFKAIVDDDKAKGDFTLSHYVRRLIGEKGVPASIERWLFRGGLAGLLLWLGPHFFRDVLPF